MSELQMQRLGMVMEPEPGNPNEVEGVLNPAAARGPDGDLYLFPRMVAKGNYSRIGIARVRFDEAGDPVGVERLGVALEPEVDYERRPDGGGGCEDPRISFVEPLQCYVMSYTAFTPRGPRIALAVSDDLLQWRRVGLASFDPLAGVEFDGVDDKDASIFPVAVPDPYGRPSIAMIHRPLFPRTCPEEVAHFSPLCGVDIHHESMWISYSPVEPAQSDPNRIGRFTSHHRLASPVAWWEWMKVGGGAPPMLTRHGWLVVYHGVRELDATEAGADQRRLCYSAGAMMLCEAYPRFIRHRSPDPILTPKLSIECKGTIANVVFPTGIDRRDDLGTPERFDIYYGMADDRIGAARLDVPDLLPTGAVVDAPRKRV